MRLGFLLALIFAAAPRQDKPLSSASVSAGADSLPALEQHATPSEPLAVSLDRIRELLALPAPLQQSLERRPTFKMEVEEKHHIQELLATLHIERPSGPVPPGGSYNYETQRVMAQALGRPGMQPYAAFSGGELLTLALEGLIGKYLGWLAVDAVTAADRARAEAAARTEVAHAVAQYCEGLPDKGAGLQLCTEPLKP
jgi:hypothetical protein